MSCTIAIPSWYLVCFLQSSSAYIHTFVCLTTLHQIEHFLNKISNELKQPQKIIPKESISLMLEYDWPGNIRELENMLINVCITTRDNVIPENNIQKYISSQNIFNDDTLSDNIQNLIKTR